METVTTSVDGCSQAHKGHPQDFLDNRPDVVKVLQLISPERKEVVQPLCEALRTKQNSTYLNIKWCVVAEA